jgi:hypothetical protein
MVKGMAHKGTGEGSVGSKKRPLTNIGLLLIGVVLVSFIINIHDTVIRGYVKRLHRSINAVDYLLGLIEENCLKATDNKVNGALSTRMLFRKDMGDMRSCHLPLANIRTLAVINCYAPFYVVESYCRNGLMKDIRHDMWAFQYANASSDDPKLLAEYGVEWIIMERKDRPNFSVEDFRPVLEFELGQRRLCVMQNLKCVGRAYVVDNSDLSMRKASIVKDDPQQIIIRAVSKNDNDVLVLSDNWYPGWRAYLNDEETEIDLYKGHMLSVPLRPGKNTIRFVYSSSLVRFSAILSLTSFLVAALVLLFGFRHPDELKKEKQGMDKSNKRKNG